MVEGLFQLLSAFSCLILKGLKQNKTKLHLAMGVGRSNIFISVIILLKNSTQYHKMFAFKSMVEPSHNLF